jgi:hypothetical protein
MVMYVRSVSCLILLTETITDYHTILGSRFRASYFNMYKYIQRDATVSWFLFQELYMFQAFTMPIIRSTLLHRQPLV